MITYNRPAYTRLALERLLASCDDYARVWLWQNGSDPETMAVVSEFAHHPCVYRYFHCVENSKLRAPTNWILREGSGDFVSKVDDDCLVPLDWLTVLKKAHFDEPKLGAVGCWRFMPEDFLPDYAEKKIRTFKNSHRLLCHPWVEGSGFLMKRQCVNAVGLLRNSEQGIPSYLIRVARKGWVNGWYYPFLWQEHMDDPRAPNSLIKSNEDLQRHLPLSAAKFGAATVEDWDKQLRRSAEMLQKSPASPAYYSKWRSGARRRIRKWLPFLSDFVPW